MKTILFSLLVLFSITTAEARSFCTKSYKHDLDLPCEVEETYWYAGGSLGRAALHAQNTSAVSSLSSNSLVFGRRFTDRLAIEGGYTQFGSFFNLYRNQALEVHAYSLALVGRQPLDSGHYVSLYGKLGYASSVVNIIGVGHNWHGDWTYGAGVEFTLDSAHNWFMRVGVDQFNTGALTVIVPGLYEPKDSITNYSALLLVNF